jgi:hypothetical protein
LTNDDGRLRKVIEEVEVEIKIKIKIKNSIDFVRRLADEKVIAPTASGGKGRKRPLSPSLQRTMIKRFKAGTGRGWGGIFMGAWAHGRMGDVRFIVLMSRGI